MFLFDRDLNPIRKYRHRLPERLYKYRSFDVHGNGLMLAANGEVRFSSARDFNDPFDNYFNPKSKLTKLSGIRLEEFLRKKASQSIYNPDGIPVEKLVQIGIHRSELLKKGDPAAIQDVLDIQYDGFGILSLTSEKNSLPLWAYYADSHEGMCIGISMEAIAELQLQLLSRKELLMLHKVKYRSRVLSISVDTKNGQMSRRELREIERTLYHKSSQWKHEKEFRLIFESHPSETIILGTEAIDEIILGVKASPRNEKTLLDLLENAGSKASVFRARKARDEFKLVFDRIR